MDARMRSPWVVFLTGLAFASCTEEAPTDVSVAPARCSTRADCPPLPDHEVFCEEGGCVARTATGALRGDCDRSGRYLDDVTRDAANCGACGRRCLGMGRCEAGSCVGSCAGDDTLCGEACVDLRRDASHCGACGRACAPGEACFGGRCDLACAAGQTPCAAGCATLATDRANCGACENACVGNRRCVGGACRDLQGDSLHCGACRRRCGAQERVADDDGDGFDDLLVWTGDTATTRVVFPGGPDGLVEGRCTRVP